jgi:hypothetical protein
MANRAKSHDPQGFWPKSWNEMSNEIRAGRSLAGYELACARIGMVWGKLNSAKNSHSFLNTGSVHVGTRTPFRSAVPRDESSMTLSLFKRILQKCCRHRFSWPHNGMNGQDYQVCLICGAAYEFDCSTMTRTGRLVEAVDMRAPGVPARPARVSRSD